MKKTTTLKIGILVDPYGCLSAAPEEEVEEHKETLLKLLPAANIKFYRMDHAGDIKPRTDIVLFDFGGMLLGNDLAGSNARQLIPWCQENTNSLMMVMSSFTYRNVIKWELQELGFESLHNLIDYFDNLDKPIPDWFLATHDLPLAEEKPKKSAQKSGKVPKIFRSYKKDTDEEYRPRKETVDRTEGR